MEVRNVSFDPSCQREAGRKRMREPSLAFEYAWIKIRGTKEINPGRGGGLRWTVRARYEEFAHFQRMGVDSARRAVWLRESAMNGRVLRLSLIHI